MTRKTIAVTAGLLLGVAGLTAQTGGGRGGAGSNVPMEFQQAGSWAVGSSGATTAPRKTTGNGSGPLVVAGKPVSATEERKSVQTLGDGTEISTSESNLFYRDSQGRTRVEQSIQGKTTIAIMDPVGRFLVTLDPANKTAHKTAIPADANIGGLSIAGGAISWSFGTGNRMTSGSSITVVTGSVASVGGGMTARGGVGVGSGGGGGVGVMTARGGSLSAAAAAPRTQNTVTNEELPVQSQNGVLATGTRSTMTIPQGQIGNNRDLHIVNERWFSDDLQMLVKSVNSDPRFGDNIYQLSNISRIEPDPLLFQIPVDYTVSEGRAAAAAGSTGTFVVKQ
jgi:hypothetical protein